MGIAGIGGTGGIAGTSGTFVHAYGLNEARGSYGGWSDTPFAESETTDMRLLKCLLSRPLTSSDDAAGDE